MRDTSPFAGYSSPAEVLSDPALSATEKATALYAWRGAAERARHVHVREVRRHTAFVSEIDKALQRLSDTC